jgi:HNH endonuclease
MIDSFYRSKEWLSIRYDILRTNKARCCACGRTPQKDKISVHVDHIVPRFVRPDRSLDRTNLQILCGDCNIGKSCNFSDDWTNDHLIKKHVIEKNEIKKSCSHEPYWKNKIEEHIFKNNTLHYKMKCVLCGAEKHINKVLAKRILSGRKD